MICVIIGQNVYSMNRYVIAAFVIVVLMIPVSFFWHDLQRVFGNKLPVVEAGMNGDQPKKDKKEKKKKEDKKEEKAAEAPPSTNVLVTQKWSMPKELTEISGMAFLGNNQFACIQDEDGSIFIYNTATNKVDKEIPFGKHGDYEGIAVVGSTAYVLRSDGTLFEVTNYLGNNPSTQKYKTSLTSQQDVEGLCYDKNNNRLLLAIKGIDSHSNDYKGIYAFNLSTKQLAPNPVYKIDLNDKIWDDLKEKKAQHRMQPSDIAIHPTTGDLYLVDGPRPKLLVMDTQGHLKRVYNISRADFKQPEGLSFTPAGELYISSEGVEGAGVLARVEIEN